MDDNSWVSPSSIMYRTASDPMLHFEASKCVGGNTAAKVSLELPIESLIGRKLSSIIQLDSEQEASVLNSIITSDFYEFPPNSPTSDDIKGLEPQHAISAGKNGEFYLVFKARPSVQLDKNLQRLEAEKSVMISAVHEIFGMSVDFTATSRAIFDLAKKITGAKAGYIALLNPNGRENDVLFLDQGDEQCDVDPTLTMPVRGLRGEVYHNGHTAYDNNFSMSPHAAFVPKGHVKIDTVMFGPLIIEGKVVGLMGLGNKPTGFTQDDEIMVNTLSHLVAVALKNCQLSERCNESRKHAEEATKAKSIFLSHMAHEIRTPLYPILALTQILMSTLQESADISGEELSQNFSVIYDSSQHLLSIINDILDFSKIEAGKLDIDNRPFSLYGSLSKALSIITPLADRNGVRMKTKFGDSVKSVVLVGDEARVRQVVINLLSNSIKFTPKDGCVTFKCKVSPIKSSSNPTFGHTDGLPRASLLVSVTDTGIGISEEATRRIFQPLEQGSAEIGTVYGGTGLGMAISKQLVEMMDGEIWFNSIEGVGSTFSFTLNLPTSHATPRSPQTPVSSTPMGMVGVYMKNLHVLVVDDAIINQVCFYIDLLTYIQKVTVAILKKLGVPSDNLAVAGSGQDALKLIKDPSRHFDIVLLDVQMPEMDGLEVLERLNEYYEGDQDLTRPQIAMLSAMAEKSISSRAFELGARKFFCKPLKIDKLAAFLRSVAMMHVPPLQMPLTSAAATYTPPPEESPMQSIYAADYYPDFNI